MVKIVMGAVILGLVLGLSFVLFQKNTERQNTGVIAVVKTQEKINTLKLTIDRIFSENKKTSDLGPNKLSVMVATGDVIPARSVNFQASKFGYRWAFSDIAETLSKGDITFINLETPLIADCPLTQEGMIFCGSDKHVEGLLMSGVDVASLGNNHAGNYGEAGVRETVGLLNSNGILAVGVEGLVVKEIKGVKFGFLGYNDITSPQPGVVDVEEAKIKEEIGDSKQKVDILVVAFHWGIEYRNQPDERQKYLGKLAIESGADLVIGNHPHWIQPVQIYRGKLIAYAHGNTIFDQMWSEETMIGVIGRYYFYGKELVDVEYIPIGIRDYGQAYLLEGLKKKEVLDKMREGSIKLTDEN